MKPVSREDRNNLDMLARRMRETWDSCGHPDGPVAGNAVRGRGFLSLGRKSVMISRALEGRRLTDLGAAEPSGMLEFARAYGASEYVGVDSFFDYSGRSLPGRAKLVNDDLLRYLFSQDDGSSNIVMNAIDGVVLMNPDRVIEETYSQLLLMQIARVIPPGGIAFGLLSPVLRGLGAYGFVKVGRTDAGPLEDMEELHRKPLRQI
ncbi:MAG TPA: hypothetical protein VLD37_03855 [Candidatus Bilamarchaeum sp.]|nr:hypothetical protein [Candidatus Bilamarchaeum sp.]